MEIAKGDNQFKLKRICCSECSTTETYSNWRKDGKSGWLCKKCYMRNWFRRHPKAVERSYQLRVKNSVTYNSKYVAFKNKAVRLTTTSRTGVCNMCRAVVGQINTQIGILCKRTEMHHLLYNENKPDSNILELCKSCHAKNTPQKKRKSRKIIVGDLVVINR